MSESPTPPQSEQTQKQEKTLKKRFNWLIEKTTSPVTLGVIISILFVAAARNFYTLRAQNDSERKPQLLFQLVEWADQKSQDLRYRFRGEMPIKNPAALLTIDDRSIEEVGRWPWSREKTAQVLDELMKHGASAVGLDITFSEPQIETSLLALQRIEQQASQQSSQLPDSLKSLIEDEKKRSQPDLVLASVIEKYKNKIVVGAFNEESESEYVAFQDYCRNEAFKRANAEKFVKLNTSFIVADLADPFDSVEFEKVFDLIFPHYEKQNTEKFLAQVFNKKTAEELNEMEKKSLKFLLEQENMSYCKKWLTKEDPYMEPSQDAYLKIFSSNDILKGLPFDEALHKFKLSVKSHPIRQHQRWTINIDELQTPADYTASFNAEQDSDGTIRRATLFFRTGNRIGTSFIPSLSLQTFLAATGYQARIEIEKDPRYPDQKILTKFSIYDVSKDPEVLYAEVPVDGQGRMKINYYGGTYMFPYLPAKELLSDKDTMTITQNQFVPELNRWAPISKEVKKSEFIKDRAFIFGATAIGVYDLRVTPYEKNYPGPETHVSALGNFYDRNFLKLPADEHRWMPLALLVFGIIFTIIIGQVGAVAGLLLTALFSGGIFALDAWLFTKYLTTITMVLPFFLVISLYVVLTFYKYFTEERKKKHLRSTFSKYVSPAVVDEILKDPENIELGGKKQRMSVFFSDLRNFTTISEKLQATELSDVLNLYLTPMTQIVFANKGTLDKYIGDAVMAFFGAPISFPDHSQHACRCALASIAKLTDIRNEIDQKFPGKNIPIEIGIGINTADVSVGNMGSDIVRSYTVMGDGVNLASRLEGITKEYGVKIVISEFVHADVKDSFCCRELDWVRVKGKKEPVRIFELIAEGAAPSEWAPTLQHFSEGFKLYHERNFSAALDCFKKSLESKTGDAPSELYIERCEEYLQEPPPPEWDGVHVMKTK